VVEKLADVEQGMARLNRLSDYLLDISRMREGRVALERSKVDLDEVVRQVVERTRVEQPEAARALTVGAPSAVHGWWDRLRLEQIVTNLVGNAVKFAGEKPIAVSVTSDEGRRR